MKVNGAVINDIIFQNKLCKFSYNFCKMWIEVEYNYGSGKFVGGKNVMTSLKLDFNEIPLTLRERLFSQAKYT